MRQLWCLICTVAGICVTWLPSAGATEAAIASLYASETAKSSVSPGQERTYSVELEEGDYLLSVDQGGLDLIVALSEPLSITVNAPTYRDDRETILVRASERTAFTVSIKSDDYTGVSASYSISIEVLDDPNVVSAYQLMTAAAAANYAGGSEKWQEALEAYKGAQALWLELGYEAEQARTLYSIGFLQYWQFFAWNDAARSAAAAAELYQAAHLPGLAANASQLQAASLIEAGSEIKTTDQSNASAHEADEVFAEAFAIFEEAARVQTDLNNNYDKAWTINNIGLTYLYRDDLRLARTYFVQAAQSFRRLDEWSGEMTALANLAVIDHEKGRLGNAVEAYERLLDVMPDDREAGWRSDTLDNLAAAQLVLGRTDSAMQNYFAALQIHESLDNAKGQGRSLSGIGSTYLAIGEIELARDYLVRALALRQAAHDGKGQVADLRVLADIHRLLGEISASLDYHSQALELATSPVVRARVLVQLSRDWIDSGIYERAEGALATARDAAEVAGAVRVSADAAYETGRLPYSLEDAAESVRWLQKAHDLYAGIGLRTGQARSLLALGQLALADDVATAIAHGLEAVNLIEDMRGQVADLELRAVYLGRRADYYEFLIGALMQASANAANATVADDYVQRALEISERARARATVDLINEAAIDFTRSIDPDILARRTKLEQELVESVYRRDRLLEASASADEIEVAVAEVQATRTELDVLETEARRSSARFAELNDPTVLGADELQAMLEPDTVVLQYSVGERSSFLWIITLDAVRSIELAGASDVNGLARRVYEHVAAPGVHASSAKKRQDDIDALSTMVLAPAASALRQNHRVIIAADGALQYLPFSVLSPDGEAALYETHDVVVVPSLTVIATQREALLGRAVPAMTLAVIGDPVFDDTDPRLDEHSSTRSAPASANLGNNLARLPFSGREVDSIAALVEPSSRFVATGFEASRNSVAGDSLQDYRYVHFATHGLIDASQPALSTLALSMRDVNGAPVDGFLRLRDIYDLELNADLVVLSACDTALGREIRGEGLIGFTQGFLSAGAARVVASLWQVPDRATAELMTRFYANMLDRGQRPVAALRAAQLEMASDRRWRDPYYWSGFVVLGEWR